VDFKNSSDPGTADFSLNPELNNTDVTLSFISQCINTCTKFLYATDARFNRCTCLQICILPMPTHLVLSA